MRDGARVDGVLNYNGVIVVAVAIGTKGGDGDMGAVGLDDGDDFCDQRKRRSGKDSTE